MRPVIAGVLVAACVLVGPGAPRRARAEEADPWFARDKALHFGASAAIAAGGYGASALVLDRPVYRAMTGAGLALAAGIGKELADLAGPGDASSRDLAWDLVGVLTGTAVAWLVDRYVW